MEKRNSIYTCYRQHYWEETVGQLERIWRENGLLKALIGKIILILPPELEEALEPFERHKDSDTSH